MTPTPSLAAGPWEKGIPYPPPPPPGAVAACGRPALGSDRRYIDLGRWGEMAEEAFTAGAKWRKPDHMLGRHVIGLSILAGLARSVRLDVVTDGLRRPRSRPRRHLRRDVEELSDVDRIVTASFHGRPLRVMHEVQEPIGRGQDQLAGFLPNLWHLPGIIGNLKLLLDHGANPHCNPHRLSSLQHSHHSLRSGFSVREVVWEECGAAWRRA